MLQIGISQGAPLGEVPDPHQETGVLAYRRSTPVGFASGTANDYFMRFRMDAGVGATTITARAMPIRASMMSAMLPPDAAE